MSDIISLYSFSRWTDAIMAIVVFATSTIAPIDAIQYIGNPDVVFLDVRESYEYETGHIPGAWLIPWNSGVLAEQFSSLPSDKPLIVYCRSGGRGAAATSFLEKNGFTNVMNMTGGFSAYSILPDAPIATGPYDPSTFIVHWMWY